MAGSNLTESQDVVPEVPFFLASPRMGRCDRNRTLPKVPVGWWWRRQRQQEEQVGFSSSPWKIGLQSIKEAVSGITKTMTKTDG